MHIEKWHVLVILLFIVGLSAAAALIPRRHSAQPNRDLLNHVEIEDSSAKIRRAIHKLTLRELKGSWGIVELAAATGLSVAETRRTLDDLVHDNLVLIVGKDSEKGSLYALPPQSPINN